MHSRVYSLLLSTLTVLVCNCVAISGYDVTCALLTYSGGDVTMNVAATSSGVANFISGTGDTYNGDLPRPEWRSVEVGIGQN